MVNVKCIHSRYIIYVEIKVIKLHSFDAFCLGSQCVRSLSIANHNYIIVSSMSIIMYNESLLVNSISKNVFHILASPIHKDLSDRIRHGLNSA